MYLFEMFTNLIGVYSGNVDTFLITPSTKYIVVLRLTSGRWIQPGCTCFY